jgi:hypothetical protein
MAPIRLTGLIDAIFYFSPRFKRFDVSVYGFELFFSFHGALSPYAVFGLIFIAVF